MDKATGSGTALVIEDNDANLLLARVMLERDGWQVVAARSANEAREVLANVTPSFILMDVGLPGQDGLSLTTELKQETTTSAIPIIALTAHAMQSDRDRAFAAGCDGYLSKPFKSKDLRTEIARVMGETPGSDEPTTN